jgi:Uma2 family endonuclease
MSIQYSYAMPLAESAKPLTEEEFIHGETDGGSRHEYINGRIYAMAGGSTRHNVITLNLAGQLLAGLRDSPCQVFMADMKVKIQTIQESLFYYPDVMACCDPAEEDYFKTKPVLVIEVLSPSTQRQDRHEKFQYYRALASLQEYVLVEQDFPRVELYRRRDDWRGEEILAGGEVRLESVDIVLPLQEIYRKTGI